MNYGCSDDGGKVQLNNQRDTASRHSSICSYRLTSSQHNISAAASRRASSASRHSAAADVIAGSRDSRKTSGDDRSRHNSVSVGNVRAQTSVGSASLDEYQHNDLVGDGDHQRQKNKARVTINDNQDHAVDDTACFADIVRTQQRSF